jgi:phage terminase large subunit
MTQAPSQISNQIRVPDGFVQYQPSGSALALFYDKSALVGVCGPAGTGKSRGCVEKLHLCAEKYPGSRLLICRKTRASLTETALWTYENEVLPPGHKCKDGGRRSHRQSYIYPNGSEMIVCGLDDAQKIMSAQYDIIYIQEITEVTKNDVEMLMTRLRNDVIPYQQIIFDCNPSYPLHWVNQGSLAGNFKMYSSYHEDNPRLWEQAPAHIHDVQPEWPDMALDGRVGRWTQKGLAYIDKLSKNTSGARHKRLRLGLWASAEGAVYEMWDANIHIVPNAHARQALPLPREWQRVWSLDFGFTAPFVWQCWAIDGDGRGWLEHQIYMSNRTVDQHAVSVMDCIGWGLEASGQLVPVRADYTPLPIVAVCDWDGDGRVTMERAFPGIRFENAYKASEEDGLQACAMRLKVQKDGLPRLLFLQGSLYEVDKQLVEDTKPARTEQEFDSFVWDTKKMRGDGASAGLKETPIKENDHGMDCMRYFVGWLDRLAEKVGKKDVAMASQPAQYVQAVKRQEERRHLGSWRIFNTTRNNKSAREQNWRERRRRQ